MKTLDGNGIVFELKDCTIVIKAESDKASPFYGVLTIGTKFKHNGHVYGNYFSVEQCSSLEALSEALIDLGKWLKDTKNELDREVSE